MLLTTRGRLMLVLPVYFAVFYFLYFSGMDGGDTAGLMAFLLAAAGLFVVVQATWLRGRLTATGVLLWNPAVIAALGLVFGTLSAGEAAAGVAAGLVVGVLTSFAVLWLGSLVQLRRRPRIFLSYRRADAMAETTAIFTELSRRYQGRNVFMDVHTIRPGHDFRDEISRIMRRCDAVFVVVGRRWLDITDSAGRRRLTQVDDPVRIEVETALAADLIVLPVLVGGATLPAAAVLPAPIQALSFRHAISVNGVEDIRTVLIPRFEAAFRPYTADSVLPPPPRARLRRRLAVASVVIALLAPFAMGLGREVVKDVGRLGSVTVAPDGVQVAAIVHGGLWSGSSLRIWNSVTGASPASYRYGRDDVPPNTLSWSPDSRRLAVGADDGTITIRSADSLSVQLTVSGYQGTFRGDKIGWSPDGTMIAAADDTGTLRVWRADTGAVVGSVPVSSTYSSEIAWSPRSDAVAATSLYLDGLVVVDVSAAGLGSVHRLSPNHTSSASSIGWAPDGTALVAGFYDDPHLVVYRRSGTGFSTQELPWQRTNVSDVEWSPDGRSVATAGSSDSIVRVFDTASGALIQQFLMKDAHDPTIAWAPGGDAVASADETQILAWPVSGAAPAHRWNSPQDFFGSHVLAWTKDGRLLTEGGGDHIVRVWRVGQAEPISEWSVTPWQVLAGLAISTLKCKITGSVR